MNPPQPRWLKLFWMLIYLGCLSVMGWAIAGMIRNGGKHYGLEIVIYILTLVNEAVLPGLSRKILVSLPKSTETFLQNVHSHLMLTLTSCMLLICWSSVLFLQGEAYGPLARIWVIAAFFTPVGVILYVAFSPTKFVGFEAYRSQNYVKWLWPPTVQAPISLVRTILTFLTLFLPIVRYTAAT
jgi:hypothetical protein